jgi:hypothetical protein
MSTLAEICDEFQTGVEALNPGAEDYAVHIRGLITRLVQAIVELVGAEYSMGEIPAIVARGHEALAALSGEAEAPEDRRCRYRSRAAVLNLLMLADGIQSHHAGSRAQQRRTAEALRDLVADALSDLVEAAE